MTSTERGPSWSERLNPRNWNLAAKLVVVGLVPTLLALALGVLRVSDQADTAAALSQSSRLLDVRAQVSAAADALRAERNSAVLYVAGNRAGDRGPLRNDTAATDAQLTKLRDSIGDASTLDRTTASALQRAQGSLGQLSVLRSETLDSQTPVDDVTNRYTAVVEQVDVFERALLRQLRTPEAAGLADALTAVTTAKEQLALQHTVLGGAIAAGQLRPADVAAATATNGSFADAATEYQVALTPEQATQFGNFATDPANANRQRIENEILATAPNRPLTVDPTAWNQAYQASVDALDKAGAGIGDALTASSTAAQENASNQAGINSVILMLGLLLAVTIMVLVARSLIRSLQVLRNSALDVAEKRLPQAVESMRAGETPNANVEPVPLSSRDEVGQVARAFDAVHGQAVRLAADQAALQANVSSMFVNLSRRSQALVERQLQLIEQLESNEQDPDQLSNLFQLDHLATRMRRNSENLLVLAGTDLSKRNVAPVPVVDVLRAAVSEIEQYQRIVVQAPPTATVMGRAASDLVHLLAELLDNATNFSPPDSQVVMSTTRTADGSILVEIADRGVGMADHELSDANQRLGGPSSIDVSASRRMGLFVVGRLAARHGIGVRLGTSAVGAPGGLTASVTVPSYLIPSSEPEPERPTGGALPPAPSAPGYPQGGGSTPQRTGTNGHGRTGSLSSLVAGNDGPMSPAGAFQPAPTPLDEHPSFPSMPLNGAGPALPTRRPGSSLRPDGSLAGQNGPARGDQDAGETRPQNDQPRNGVQPPSTPGQQPVEQSGGTPAVPGETDAAQGPAVERSGANPSVPRAFDARPASPQGFTPGTTANGSGPADQRPRIISAPAVPPAPPTAPIRSVSPVEPAGAPAAERPEATGPSTEQSAPSEQSVQSTPAAAEASGAPQASETAAAQRAVPEMPARRPDPRDATATPPPAGPGPVAQPMRPVIPPATSRPRDGLFAPSVPMTAEPNRPGQFRRTGPEARPSDQFDPQQTTPIFEEIASAWFRSNRPVPVNWATEGKGGGTPAGPGTPPA
ncbi:nitrate- and nitrite sensing domain-containing protein, partial [Pseudonocardia acidicola]|nr:HAMP domain-containing protein [Pseudonocardia acidicola]